MALRAANGTVLIATFTIAAGRRLRTTAAAMLRPATLRRAC